MHFSSEGLLPLSVLSKVLIGYNQTQAHLQYNNYLSWMPLAIGIYKSKNGKFNTKLISLLCLSEISVCNQ